MFGKYFKWELKSYFRSMWPLFLACLIVEAIMILSNFANVTGVITGLAVAVYGALLIAMIVVTFIRIVQNFWRDTYGKDAQFNMCLPVSTDARLLAHALASFLMGLAAFVIAFLPFMVLMHANKESISFVFQQMDSDSARYIVVFAVLCAVGVFENIFLIYFSEGVGALVPSHAVPVGIAVFLGLTILQNVLLPDILMNTDAELSYTAGLQQSTALMSVNNEPMQVMVLVLVVTAAVSAALYFGERYLLEKHYNLK